MIYELRIYRAMPGQMPKLLARFRDHTIKIWDRLGIRPLGFWTTMVGDAEGNTLTYMLAWESLADRETRWVTFQADAAWKAAKTSSESDGPIVANISSQLLAPTDFSALK